MADCSMWPKEPDPEDAQPPVELEFQRQRCAWGCWAESAYGQSEGPQSKAVIQNAALAHRTLVEYFFRSCQSCRIIIIHAGIRHWGITKLCVFRL